MGSRSSHANGQFLWKEHAWACPMTLCHDLYKNSWTDRDAVLVVDLAGPKMHVSSEVHSGASWRISLNRPCAAAMRHVVKLLWPLVIVRLHCSTIYIDVVCRSVCQSHCWALQKWLNQSRCHLDWRVGWAQRTMYFMGVQIRPWHFWGWSIGTLCGHLCKNGWTDRDAIWVEGSDRPKESCVRWGPEVWTLPW